MKKRTLISILITIICITLTNRFWLNIKPLQISFHAIGNGNTKFEFFLNKKDNNDFKKVNYGVVEANLDENDSVEFFINRVHGAKRVKIAVSTGITPPPESLKTLTLSEIQLRYGKYKLDDLSAFSAEGAKLKIDGEKLIISPEDDSFSLIYNKPLNIKSAFKFDIKILIVIAVLAFLLAYKLTSYLADFKTLNNASKLDICFLLVFFVLLFIPMSNINKEESSLKERRTLATFKPFINNNEINFNFGNDFNDWFNDRFFLRFKLIKAFINLKYRIASNYFEYTRFSLNKQNNWVFDNKKMENLNDLTKTKNFEIYLNNIIALNKYCQNHNIKLYIFISPIKEYIYKENNLYRNLHEENTVKFAEEYFIKKLKSKNIPFILPVNEFRNERFKDLLFYKTDHHWTESGAFLGYQILMKEIQKDFKDIKALDKNSFNYEYQTKVKYAASWYFYSFGSSIESMLIDDPNILDSQYKYFNIPNSQNVKILSNKKPTYFKIKYKEIKLRQDNFESESYNPSGKYKAFILGNSYTAAITPYFQNTFKEMYQRRYNIPLRKNELSIRLYKKEIEKLKPDILIICIDFPAISELKNLAKGVE